ncbi:hypothetical protein PLICRDRAFT_38413 [Plicaturopsis crispa FD-325 SS-3]|nr:hypothetical protein PLICRDRAFT_38413 [Plicaturopsis crispa FD-325 SS-3]
MSSVLLPTLGRLGTSIPPSTDAKQVAQDWLSSFSTRLETGDIPSIPDLFVDDAFVRDILALTWDFRTFQGSQAIRAFFEERVSKIAFTKGSFVLSTAEVQQPYPDLAWIMGMFRFETDVALASGVFRLVPTANGNEIAWKAHALFTNMEDLKGFPEKIGALRDPLPNHGRWAEKRRREVECEDGDPTVLIVGGGQSGLELGARLKALDVTTLVVEKQPRIGDQWRKRYEALCLHDPVWYDHMPYLPFPPTWPVYTPALKLAGWLESYAEQLELNVWTSATVTHATQDASTKKWTVTVERAGGKTRTLVVNHLVFAAGIGGGMPRLPEYPGMDKFEGQLLHSSQHTKAADHAGKKVVVVGACTSGHDICSDYVNNGVDVTLYQRGPTYVMSTKEGYKRLMNPLYVENGPPTDVADRLHASFPNNLLKLMHKRMTDEIAEADKDILDGLRKRGFKLTSGIDGSGFLLLAWSRAGGYYLDVGASQLIIDGKIKLKNDSPIAGFTPKGLAFEDGSTLDADVVIFATGYGEARDPMRRICGDEVADQCKRIWGLDKEGELNGCWRDVGIPNMWFMMGNLALCRFHSKHIALQIKAMEEGVFGTRYSMDPQ